MVSVMNRRIGLQDPSELGVRIRPQPSRPADPLQRLKRQVWTGAELVQTERTFELLAARSKSVDHFERPRTPPDDDSMEEVDLDTLAPEKRSSIEQWIAASQMLDRRLDIMSKSPPSSSPLDIDETSPMRKCLSAVEVRKKPPQPHKL